MMYQIKFFRPVKLAGDRQDVLGKTDVFVPTLKPGAQPVGMPGLEVARVVEMGVRWNQPFRRRPREVTLRDLQAIGMTAGINALIVGNYLTTLGRSADEDFQMLEDLRMPIGALTAAI